jgi:hypothetical protein
MEKRARERDPDELKPQKCCISSWVVGETERANSMVELRRSVWVSSSILDSWLLCPGSGWAFVELDDVAILCRVRVSVG